jgi:hypothetical protein
MVALCRGEKQANLKGLFAGAREVMPPTTAILGSEMAMSGIANCAAASDINVAQQLERCASWRLGSHGSERRRGIQIKNFSSVMKRTSILIPKRISSVLYPTPTRPFLIVLHSPSPTGSVPVSN